MPLTIAASSGPHDDIEAATVATVSPVAAARELERHLPGRQIRARDHGREGIENVMLRFLDDLVGQGHWPWASLI